MTAGFQILCANKNPQGLIMRLGGDGWSLSHHQAIVGLLHKRLRLHIFIGNESFEIGVRGDGMDSYLVLEPNGERLSEVEGLRSC
jgi:hypothetical protein